MYLTMYNIFSVSIGIYLDTPGYVNDYNLLNPLSPHDALKHHITSLKTYLIFLQLGVLE